jgi:hypothetical protein
LVGIQPGIYFWAKYLNVATREKRKIWQTGYSNIKLLIETEKKVLMQLSHPNIFQLSIS